MIQCTNNSSNTTNIYDIDGFVNNYGICIWIAISSLIAIVIVLGNSLVLYAAKTGNMNSGYLRQLDNLIKSLALSDLLFGLVEIPFRIGQTLYLGNILYLLHAV